MKLINNYSNNQIKNSFYKDKTNIKSINNYYSNKNELNLFNIFDKKNKIKKIKPPFKRGLYSYKHSFNTNQNNFNKNNLNNNLSSFNSQNNLIIKYNNENNDINSNYINDNNNTNNNIPIDLKSQKSNYNSFLNFSSINLNKYKINITPNQSIKNDYIINDNINNYYTNINVNKNINMNLNSNLNYIKNNDDNNQNIYTNYIKADYQKENNRMLIEYLKVINNLKNNNFKKNILYNDDSSNRQYNSNKFNIINNNYSLFEYPKNQLVLKNINHSVSYDIFLNNNKKDINCKKINNLKDNKKIDILNFLFVPRVLNLIGENNKRQKYIFLLTLDNFILKEGKESYQFQWRNMSNNEIENKFNLNKIKSCYINKNYNNIFIVFVKKDSNEGYLNLEIETPSEEICYNYVKGINYLLSNYKR